MMRNAPELHEVLSVQPTDDDGSVIAMVDMTDIAGERYTTAYYLRPNDPYGLAPTIRDWIAAKNPTVLPKATVVRATESVPSITSTQFFKALALRDKITMSEAVAAVRSGTPPWAIDDMLGKLPPAGRFEAAMALWGAASYSRHHVIAPLLGGAFGWSEAHLDDFWRYAATL